MAWINILFVAFFAISAFAAANAEIPPCYRDLERNFFRTDLLNETLSMHSVYQSSWSLIGAALQRNMKNVPELIRERAKKMDPNPFAPVFHSKEAAYLLRQVLFEVFSLTLAQFQITNQDKAMEMFQYILNKQSQRFMSCFGQEGL